MISENLNYHQNTLFHGKRNSNLTRNFCRFLHKKSHNFVHDTYMMFCTDMDCIHIIDHRKSDHRGHNVSSTPRQLRRESAKTIGKYRQLSTNRHTNSCSENVEQYWTHCQNFPKIRLHYRDDTYFLWNWWISSMLPKMMLCWPTIPAGRSASGAFFISLR